MCKIWPVFSGRLRNVSLSVHCPFWECFKDGDICFPSLEDLTEVCQIKGREGKKEVKSGRQKVGAGRKRYCPFVGISVLPSNSVGGSVAVCLSFLIHQMSPVVWVVEIV